MAFLRRDGRRQERASSHRAPRKPWYSSLITVLIFSLVGWIFIVNLQSNADYVPSTNTQELLARRGQRVTTLTGDIKSLTGQIDVLRKNLASGSSAETGIDNTSSESKAVSPAIEGPGITVTLDDSPLWEQCTQNGDAGAGAGDNVNDYVVHQQDIEAVVNALWSGGAEAMTIQGQRVNTSTVVRCVGNVLLLDGKQYAPPYTISAIGDPDRLGAAMDSSRAIQIYKEYVKADGLGFDVKKETKLRFGKTVATTQTLKYAAAVGATGRRND